MTYHHPHHRRRSNPGLPVVAVVAAAVVVTAGVGAAIYLRRKKPPASAVGTSGSAPPRPRPGAATMLQMPVAQAREAARRGQEWEDAQRAAAGSSDQGNQSDLLPIRPYREYTLDYRGFTVKFAILVELRRIDMAPAVIVGIAPYDDTKGLGRPTITGPGFSGHAFPPGHGIPQVIELRDNLTAQQSAAFTGGVFENPRVVQMLRRLEQRIQDAIDTYLG